MKGSSYQRQQHLDGLRGIAILLVVFYHAKIPLFSYGWLGVDVFFVLSGYLITRNVYFNILNGTFTLKSFFIRRIKRIFPALLLMCLISLPLSFLLLDFRASIESFKMVFSAVFINSSTYIQNYTNYFSTNTELKPFIHLWSLSLKSQFYLVIPFILLVYKKLNQIKLISLTLLSLMSAFYISKTNFEFAFYSLPTRLWEFLIGGFLATEITNRVYTKITKRLAISVVFLLALISFFFEVKVLQAQFLIVLVTGWILVFGTKSKILNLIILNKKLVNLGVISYGIFLWHQPIFAFARHIELNDLSTITYGILVILSILIAKISYKYLELPILEDR